MAQMYSREVPAYSTLVKVVGDVNADVSARDGAVAERLGSIGRVTEERHGAIRVGTPMELQQVSRIFAALGMYPVGFYDLREVSKSSVPVVSTAFRPIDPRELEVCPFRMYTSLLVTDDRRFFSSDLQERLDTFLARRSLFHPDLLTLSDKAVADSGLRAEDAEKFLSLAVEAFELSQAPVNRAWYAELDAVSAVAADIGASDSTHINHLTPRVLDIDELYRRMIARGIGMIDTIQGPPRWDGPDVLLRQTSFRALAEARSFAEPNGTITSGSLRVRFGEVEARGIALTPKGRDRYDAVTAVVDARLASSEGRSRQDVAAEVWTEEFPNSDLSLLREGLAFFEFAASGNLPRNDLSLAELVHAGVVTATPIVYEDFLPRSAAGIFQSNLTSEGTKSCEVEGTRRDAAWVSDVVGAEIPEPFDLYAAQQRSSVEAIAEQMGVAFTQMDPTLSSKS
jgi:uncharacterized glyoxalase superfamily metalloenzyme YdcJ